MASPRSKKRVTGAALREAFWERGENPRAVRNTAREMSGRSRAQKIFGDDSHDDCADPAVRGRKVGAQHLHVIHKQRKLRER